MEDPHTRYSKRLVSNLTKLLAYRNTCSVFTMLCVVFIIMCERIPYLICLHEVSLVDVNHCIWLCGLISFGTLGNDSSGPFFVLCATLITTVMNLSKEFNRRSSSLFNCAVIPCFTSLLSFTMVVKSLSQCFKTTYCVLWEIWLIVVVCGGGVKWCIWKYNKANSTSVDLVMEIMSRLICWTHRSLITAHIKCSLIAFFWFPLTALLLYIETSALVALIL